VVGGVFAEERPPKEVGFRDSWGDDSFGGRRVIGGRFMIEQYRGHWNAYELSAVEPPVEEISFDEGQEILDSLTLNLKTGVPNIILNITSLRGHHTNTTKDLSIQ
jgi:hypothetical protein